MTQQVTSGPDLEFSIYVSRAIAPYSHASLQEWSKSFAAKNAALEITGLLLTVGDHFVQMLEGERDVILNLLKTIQRDPRHTDFRLIYLRSADHRTFAQWAMRWISLDEKIYLGFDEMVKFRDSVRRLVGNNDAQKDRFASLIRSLPVILTRHQLT